MPWIRSFVLVASLLGVITAIMGLLLSMEEDRSGTALQWHKWGGISIAVVGFLFYHFHNVFHRYPGTARIFTLFACALIVFAGHWGAVLTHGKDYLLAPMATNKMVPVSEAIVFKDVVRPILEGKCLSCHGEVNIKGGLIMDNLAGLLEGGKTGPLFKPGDAAGSLLIQRIHLPVTDKKHMPPRSKPQLTEEETSLLYAWIKSGALLDKKLTLLPVQDSFRILASFALGAAAETDQPVYDFPPAAKDKIAALNNNFRVLEQLGTGSPALAVHFYGREQYSSKALEELLSIKLQVVELTLARMPVKDNDLNVIRQMPNLRKLNLNYTEITSKGLGQLNVLKNLQVLALSGTSIDQSSLEKLLALPHLLSVYAWNTSIDSAQVTSMYSRFKRVMVETGYVDDKELITVLSPPVIIVPPGILAEPTEVEIKHPFKGVDIRYSTNGDIPDSVTGTLYKQPVYIDNNTTLTARAFKKGWYGSNETRASYIKKGYPADSIEMITPLDPKYKNASASLLTDGDLGDVNVGNGQWLGYQVNDAGFLLYFKEPVMIENVLLNMLQNTKAFIFPPTHLEVWGGRHKDSLKLLGKMLPLMPTKQESPQLVIQKVSFNAASVKVLKVLARHVVKLPEWHPGKGKPGWVFVNEIVVN